MPGETYSAGTIFLQVVPVFGDVQNAIRRNVQGLEKSLGDDLEKAGRNAGKRGGEAMGQELEKAAEESGDKAGQKYQGSFSNHFKGMAKAVQRELDGINLDTASAKTIASLERVKRMAKEIGDVDVSVDADVSKALEKVAIVKAETDALRKAGVLTIRGEADLDKAMRDLAAFDKYVDGVRERTREIKVGAVVDRQQIDRAMGAFERRVKEGAKRASQALGDSMNKEIQKLKAELDALGDMEIGIDISDGDFRRKASDIQARLKRLSMASPEISVKFDAGKAEAEMGVVLALADRLDGKNINMKADVKTGEAVAKMGLLNALFSDSANGSDAAANSFRSFNAIILAAVTLIPALIPVIGALAGGLLALGPILGAVGAGIGAVVLGFSGIGTAIQALDAKQKAGAKDTNQYAKTMRAAGYAVQDAQAGVADAVRNAARAEQDAARQVADARRNAARAVEAALEQQKSAQESYASSVHDVQQAEKDLRDARKQAAEDKSSLKDKVKDNRLAIRQGVLNAFDATNNLNAVNADGSSTAYDKEQAAIQHAQALQSLHELREEQKQLSKDKKKSDKQGVDGTDAVTAAQYALTEALQKQKDAQVKVGEAARDVNRARADGARAVAAAILNQQRAEADGARSIAKAREQQSRAEEAYQQALKDTGDIGSSANQKLEQAMDALGPAGRRFARFIFGLKSQFSGLRDSVQEALLPHVQRAIEGVIKVYGPAFEGFMTRMARAAGGFFEALGQSLTGPAWKNFFAVMNEISPKLFTQFGKATIDWLEIFAQLMAIVAPWAVKLSGAMLKMSNQLDRWMQSRKGTEAISNFMQYAARVGPDVVRFLGAFVRAATNLVKALAPWGDLVLKLLTKVLDTIGHMDTKKLGLIATSILTMVIAFQSAVGATAAIKGGFSAFATVGGRLVFSLIGIVGIVAILAVRYKSVRDILADLAGFVHDHIKMLTTLASIILTAVAAYKAYWAITKLIEAVQIGLAAATYGAAGATYAQAGASKVAYTAARLYAAGQWLMNASIMGFPLIWIIAAVIAVIAIIILLWKHNETFRKLVTAAWNGIKKVAEIVFAAIVKAFQWLADTAVDVWKNYLSPVISAIADAFVWLWEHAIQPYLGKIVAFWHGSMHAMKKAWDAFLWPLLDLMIHIWKKIFQLYFKVYFGAIVLAWKVGFKSMKFAWEHILHPTINAFADAIGWLWHKILKPIFGLIGDIWATEMKGLKKVYDNVVKPMIDAFVDAMGGPQGLRSKFHAVVSAISDMWSGLKKVFAAPIKFVLDTVINHGLIAGFNKVAKFVGSTPMHDIPIPKGISNAYATGGVLPGYFPGGDNHHFFSPTAGSLHLSGGESIMRPEFTSAVGGGFVNALNQAARNGGARAVKKLLNGSAGHFFSDGGIFGGRSFAKGGALKNPDAKVYMDGKAIAAIAAAQVLLAEQLKHTNYYLMQGGFGGDHIAASGSSHNYPGVADISTPTGVSFADQAMLRKVGFAAWARNIPGAAYVGSGEHVHSASLLSPGTAKSPQVFGSWPGHTDGLAGGPDYGPRPAMLPGLAGLLGGFDLSHIDAGGKGNHGFGLPGWLLKIARNPIGYVGGLVTSPIHKLYDKFGAGDYAHEIAGVPMHAIKGIAHKVLDMIPGGAAIASAAGFAFDKVNDAGHFLGGAAHHIADGISDGVGHVGHVLGFSDGGILPYNGTMMYDAGGYLPPGLTQVVNMTGKPEPVFTSDQFSQMQGGGKGFTYAPTFHEAHDPDEVLDDLEFTIRKLGRTGGDGPYAGVGG